MIQTSGPETNRAVALPRRVLVATDATATSTGAERAGIELAARVGASLIVLSVIDPSRLRLPGGLFHTRVDQVRAERESALALVVDVARRHGVTAQFLIWEGDPGAAVIEAAEAEGADIIVVGSHARGPVGRLLLGSVSSHVVDHGRRPVVVIRPGQRLGDVWPIATLEGSSASRGSGPDQTAQSAKNDRRGHPGGEKEERTGVGRVDWPERRAGRTDLDVSDRVGGDAAATTRPGAGGTDLIAALAGAAAEAPPHASHRDDGEVAPVDRFAEHRRDACARPDPLGHPLEEPLAGTAFGSLPGLMHCVSRCCRHPSASEIWRSRLDER